VVFEIRDELKKANEHLATANTQLMAANTELDVANSKLIEANSRLVQANADLTVVNNNLAQTIQRLDGTNGQIATLQDKHLTSLDTRLDPLGKSLNEVDTHLGSLRKTLDNIDGMIPFMSFADSGPAGGSGGAATTDATASTGTTTGTTGVAPTDTTAGTTSGTGAPTASQGAAGQGAAPGTAASAPMEKVSRMMPETMMIDGREFRLKAYLWRNFQPTVGEAPDAKGLLAKLNLIASDKGGAPKGVEAVAIRLQRGKAVWTGTATKEAGDTAETWERMIRPGPAWEIGPGVNVFVYVELADGSRKWIAAYDQTIERVD
jgi:hypothetical protein